MHARGSAAHGVFECFAPMAKYTRASFLAEQGKRTPVFVRFSTVAGERGSIDTARDVRGFATKFYTDEGNFDIVGNNIPIFFIQDAMKFPDLVHAVKPEPHHGMPQAASAHDTFWDFVSLMPESTHMLMWVMSDRALPRSFSMMQGFGVHTFRLVNAAGESHFVKFHWTPRAGTHSLDWDESVKISGADSDYHRRDLWESIESGVLPEYELGLQIFTEAQAERFSFDVLDPTKIVPEELVPVTPVGRMVLDRNPDNFFAETEQVAFGVQNLVPGIDFSNDPLLAGRIHSYFDTQLLRLGGPNFHEIPINAPIAQAHNNQRDGIHRQAIPRGRVAYEPNSLGGGCPFQMGTRGFTSFPEPIAADKVRGKPEKFGDHYSQATLFWNSQTPYEKAHIIRAFRFELTKVQVPAIRERTVSMLRNVSDELAKPVADALGLEAAAPDAAGHGATEDRGAAVPGAVPDHASGRRQHPWTSDRHPGGARDRWGVGGHGADSADGSGGGRPARRGPAGPRRDRRRETRWSRTARSRRCRPCSSTPSWCRMGRRRPRRSRRWGTRASSSGTSPVTASRFFSLGPESRWQLRPGCRSTIARTGPSCETWRRLSGRSASTATGSARAIRRACEERRWLTSCCSRQAGRWQSTPSCSW